MDYESTLEFLFNQLPVFENDGSSAYKPGLERVLALSEAYGNPHRRLRAVVHVAGTNGKGSTAHTLAAIFQCAGYRTGLFTSPHLVDFRERIRVNGRKIGREEVVAFTERFRRSCSGLNPSFFELTTVMAFDHFVKEDVDVAVVEVGLGGRLDSTNIVDPDLSVITNISLDHTALLGNTLEAIAAEKAGIIKPGKPVVIGESSGSVREVFARKASEMNAPIRYADTDSEIAKAVTDGRGMAEVYATRSFGAVTGELCGSYQHANANTVLTAVKALRGLGFRLPDEAVKEGFANVCGLTGLAGRWMKLGDEPLRVCDTGHNPGGWHYLSSQIAGLHGRKHIIVGFVGDKDVEEIMREIARYNSGARFYFTAPSSHRRLPENELFSIARSAGLYGRTFASVTEAYEKALAEAGKGDSIFVGGSNYVIGELLASLRC